MQAARGVEHHVSGGQLHGMRAVAVLDHQFAAVVVGGIAEEQGGGEVAAQAMRRARHLKDRVVEVRAEALAAGSSD